MKNKIQFSTSNFQVIMALCAMILVSCTKVEEYDNTPTGNFEALWSIIDKQYCFFDYKADEYGLDWDVVYRQYKRKVADGMSSAGLFEVFGDMLDELRDGHVNLYAAHDVARYWDFREGYATNFSEEIQAHYLGTDYKIASGLRYTVLPDNIGYIYVPSLMCVAMGAVTSRMPRPWRLVSPMNVCLRVTLATRRVLGAAISRRLSRYIWRVQTVYVGRNRCVCSPTAVHIVLPTIL